MIGNTVSDEVSLCSWERTSSSFPNSAELMRYLDHSRFASAKEPLSPPTKLICTVDDCH
jgi:hypothetical protein